MDENSNPQGATPLETALRQIQTWFVNGDFEKVKQGCREVLSIAPNNSIAQDLLQRAEQSETPAATPTSTEAAPVANPMPVEIQAPAPEPILEEPPMPEMISKLDLTPPSSELPTPAMPPHDELHDEHDLHRTHSLAINIAILVGIVVVGILGIYGYNAFIKKGDETPPVQEENAEEQPVDEEETVIVPPSDTPVIPSPDLTTWQGRNEQRSTDLSKLEQALILYFDEFKKYPNTEEISTVFVLPTPPNDGEAYIYAVYSNDIGADQVFVLSAEFEQENGEKTVWSTGGSPNEYPDYRDVAALHVTSLHPTMTEIEYIEFMLTQPTPTPSGRVPRVPRN